MSSLILVDLQSKSRKVKHGQELTEEGGVGTTAFILQSGWTCSYKVLPRGGRQIHRIPIPGDCVGLRSMLLRTSDHSFCALTDAVVSAIDAPRMVEIFHKFPRLGAAFLSSVSHETWPW